MGSVVVQIATSREDKAAHEWNEGINYYAWVRRPSPVGLLGFSDWAGGSTFTV